MDRRTFLGKIPGLTVLPLVIYSVGCEDTADSYAAGDTDSGTTDSFRIISSTDSGHYHSVAIQYAHITTVPSSNQTLTTSSANSHSHTLTLTPADYTALQNGETILKTSSTDGGHTHSFRIMVPDGSM
ncbi:MAG: hypothetical protein ACE5D8_08385 [Fidelibacterota bacterium]